MTLEQFERWLRVVDRALVRYGVPERGSLSYTANEWLQWCIAGDDPDTIACEIAHELCAWSSLNRVAPLPNTVLK